MSVDLVCHLVQNSPVAASNSSSLPGALTAVDVHAVSNRVFLDDAVPIATAEVSAALQHLCAQQPAKETLKALEFLAEKCVEFSSAGTGGVTSINYR